MFINRLKTSIIVNRCVLETFRNQTVHTTFARQLHVSRVLTMAQTSITTFFRVTPPTEKKKLSLNVDINEKSAKKPAKRSRIESSESESETPAKVESPPSSTDKKKKTKRLRIDSSESESNGTDRQTSPLPEEKPAIKVEKTSPKTYQSPKSTKKLLKEERDNNSKVENKSPKVKEEKVSKSVKVSPKTKKEKSLVKEGSPDGEKGKKSPSPVRVSVKQEKENKKPEDKDDASGGIVPELEYDPSKSKYDPIADACWAPNAPVPYIALARTFQKIEGMHGTGGRLRQQDTLANYLRSVIALTPEDLLPSLYLSLNQLAPAAEGLELGLAETYLMKAVGGCTGRSLAQLRAAVRAGAALPALAAAARHTQTTLRRPPPLALRRVHATLLDVARMTGQASVNKKISKIQSLYVACRDCEALYLIRSLEGKLRIGLAEQSVLAALALAASLTPPPRGAALLRDASRGLAPDAFKSIVESNTLSVKSAYCSCPNYSLLVEALLAHPLSELRARCPLRAGLPLKPMLAQPTRGVHEVLARFEDCEFTCEWKYDGERAQIHVPEGAPPAVYSRNQENNTSKYPDIISRLGALLGPAVRSCVLDCEAVAYDALNKQILPFQVLSTRKRKDAMSADIKVAVCVFVFDLLMINGESLVGEELLRRRELLRQHFNEVEGQWQFATSLDCKSTEEMQQFMEAALRGGCEGLMVKALRGPAARYDIARRSRNWLKLKKDYLEGVGDTIDVVVIGAYGGRGKRSRGFGGFLVAARDGAADCFQSLCRLGTGFSDLDLLALTDKINQLLIDAPRPYYSYDRAHEPDVWVAASLVWEVRCADLSLSPAHRAAIGLVDPDKGISLRFPRFVRERPDKTPEQATSSQQIAEMYLAQDQVKNQLQKPEHNIDDFY